MMAREVPGDTEGKSNEVTLLGITAAVIESWKWFLIIPIATAFAVYFMAGKPVSSYRATALLQIDGTPVLFNSAPVLGAAIQELGMQQELGPTMDDAIVTLSGRLSAKIISPGIAQISLMGSDAEGTRKALTAIIKNFAAQIEPDKQKRQEVERQISTLEAMVEQMREYAQKMLREEQPAKDTYAASNEVALGYVALVNQILTFEDNIKGLRASLDGLSPDDVLQQPTLAETKGRSKKLVSSLLAAVVASLVVFFIVLIREMLRRIPNDPSTLSDLERIRKAAPFSKRL
jgi:hypothetical protein